jgi:hypothetical protein
MTMRVEACRCGADLGEAVVLERDRFRCRELEPGLGHGELWSRLRQRSRSRAVDGQRWRLRATLDRILALSSV